VTVFDAALDARESKLWPREQREDNREISDKSWRTQGRWLERSASLLGLRCAGTTNTRSLIAERFGLSTLDLFEAQRLFENKRRSQDRGESIALVLAKIAVRARVMDAILIAGAIAGEWGPPIRWEHSRQRRRFLLPQIGAPP
jgi:hypothetical protein